MRARGPFLKIRENSAFIGTDRAATEHPQMEIDMTTQQPQKPCRHKDAPCGRQAASIALQGHHGRHIVVIFPTRSATALHVSQGEQV
jgi:hypothetical protein